MSRHRVALSARVTLLALVALVTFLAFLPVLGFPFLNWDDQDVFVRNDALRAPAVARWAFTTHYMEHYQPLAWLTWAGVDRTIGSTPAAAHGVNLVLHAWCAALVCLVTFRFVHESNFGRGRSLDRPDAGRSEDRPLQ